MAKTSGGLRSNGRSKESLLKSYIKLKKQHLENITSTDFKITKEYLKGVSKKEKDIKGKLTTLGYNIYVNSSRGGFDIRRNSENPNPNLKN